MGNKFLLLASYQYTSEAQIYKGKLESEGIAVFIRDNNIVDSNPLYSNAVGGVKLFVKEEDIEKAKQILGKVSSFSVGDNNNLVKCPKCGAEESNLITSIKDVKSLFSFIFSFLIGGLTFYAKYKYKCNKCKNEFE